MIYNASPFAVGIFVVFVLGVLWLSSYFAKKASTSEGYYAAGGDIHWGVNGIAFAGDYLSAASFLGICGMIAFSGYDGFLYSIGYLAGWVVALFIVAEPVSYTHLTLPTILLVQISVVAVSLKKKETTIHNSSELSTKRHTHVHTQHKIMKTCRP
eukprot:TRINITY_DN13045_c0_g1_i1.p3 TRINITY_DN13045_c0_g1~~TRINITY_DN13045_c0_g1_i1.p3  ORF type:complete len:155 (-),score=22.78 TRINITY_DN13045_c0_g1_i1:2-466(-)